MRATLHTGMPRRAGRRWHGAGGPEVTVVPQGAADSVASPGLRRGAAGRDCSCVRGAGDSPGLPGAPHAAPGRASRAAPLRPLGPRGGGAGQGELGGAGVAHPGCRRGSGGPGAAPVWPRYLPAPRRSPAPSWSSGGSGAARGRPPPATGPQRGRGGGGPRGVGVVFNPGRGGAALRQPAQPGHAPPGGCPCPLRASGEAAAATTPSP